MVAYCKCVDIIKSMTNEQPTKGNTMTTATAIKWNKDLASKGGRFAIQRNMRLNDNGNWVVKSYTVYEVRTKENAFLQDDGLFYPVEDGIVQCHFCQASCRSLGWWKQTGTLAEAKELASQV